MESLTEPEYVDDDEDVKIVIVEEPNKCDSSDTSANAGMSSITIE